MLRAEKLVKEFKSGDSRLVVLKGISLEIQRGDFISIIGRSGSGKSTLLYQLGLLDYPTSGKVFFKGKDTSEMSSAERTLLRLTDLGYVFQDYALVPELTAIENVMIPLMMQGSAKFDARKSAEIVLQEVGLDKKFDNLPNQLSGGEQQRVSIARAVAHRPDIVLADEPTANLDNDTSLTILKLFEELHSKGQTIVMVTHEPEYIKYTNRTITIFDGEVKSDERRVPRVV